MTPGRNAQKFMARYQQHYFRFCRYDLNMQDWGTMASVHNRKTAEKGPNKMKKQKLTPWPLLLWT
jgi:hypothetical protein